MFDIKSRQNVDIVERDFVIYREGHPEVYEILVPTLTAMDEYPFDPVSRRSLSEEEYREAVRLAPWGYSFDLAPDLSTESVDLGQIGRQLSAEGRGEYVLRMSMLTLAMRERVAGESWLDLATNSGFIPLLLGRNQSGEIVGVDLAEVNIEKANFLKQISGERCASFVTADIYDYLSKMRDSSVDVVSALGIFYHLDNPLGLLRSIYEKVSGFIVIDTIIHNFPFSGWIQTVSRHIKYSHLGHANDTRKLVELHPTYRGMLDALFQVGFSRVCEILPSDALLARYPGTIYSTRNRRIFVAYKNP